MKSNQLHLENTNLSFKYPLIRQFDLLVCYNAKKDEMVYRRDTGQQIRLPIVFTLTSYVVGILHGALGTKRLAQLKRDILRTIKDDYKTGSLFNKSTSQFNRMLQNEYHLYLYL